MQAQLKIHVILSSTRQGRYADKPGLWILGELNQTESVTAELFDLRDWPLPFFDDRAGRADGNYGNQLARAWAARMAEADAFVIVAAEYNHGYTAVLKNALDWIYREWNKKPVAFVGYGGVGGARAVEQLRLVAIELEMAPIKRAVHIPTELYLDTMQPTTQPVAELFTAIRPNAEKMIEQLLWWTKAEGGEAGGCADMTASFSEE